MVKSSACSFQVFHITIDWELDKVQHTAECWGTRIEDKHVVLWYIIWPVSGVI